MREPIAARQRGIVEFVEEQNEVQNKVAHVIQTEAQGQVDEGHGIETEAWGEADEGERITSIVQQIENDDMKAEQMYECEYSSGEDDYPLPSEWRDHGFGNPEIQDGRSQEWEYRQNKIVQGAKYSSSDEVKEALKLWAISLRREFRVVKSSPSVYEVKCVEKGCP